MTGSEHLVTRLPNDIGGLPADRIEQCWNRGIWIGPRRGDLG